MTAAARVFSARQFAGNENAPLYLRIKKLVQDSLARGDFQEGDAIPSERGVAGLLHVSRVTVRKAFTELVHEGLLVQRRGSGTFVRQATSRIEQPLSRLTSFSEDMHIRGLKTDADWLNRSVALPTPDEVLKLSISPGERICRFHRLRRANNVPLAIERAAIPQRFIEAPETVVDSLYAALAVRGFHPVRALQRLHATALSFEEAALLEQPGGSPALAIERISYLADGQVVEFTRSLYRGDTYDFVAELALAGDNHP